MPNTELYPNRPLVCPTCAAELQPSTRQMQLSGFIALCLTVALGYGFGLRGLWLVAATIVFWFPIYIVWEFIFARIVPTRFERW